MRLKLYRGRDVAEAMTRIRSEMGPDALILATRRVAGGVEITAALEPEDEAAPPAAVRDPARTAALQFHRVPLSLHDALHEGPLAAALRSALPFAGLEFAAGTRPILLAGPPGAGKTLTTARLATRLVLGGTAPIIITADGKRAGAAEQLAAFTRLLRLNLVVASHPVTLGRALARRPDAAPVLIDTPGLDPFDPPQREELRALSATAGATVALVLPAGMDAEESADLAAAFAEAGATLLIATRMDLARRLGNVLAAAVAGRLALAEAGIGPGAADGLTALTPDFLAERLLAARAPVLPERCP
jgi:flagellar biosynthesis protein FlhF